MRATRSTRLGAVRPAGAPLAPRHPPLKRQATADTAPRGGNGKTLGPLVIDSAALPDGWEVKLVRPDGLAP